MEVDIISDHMINAYNVIFYMNLSFVQGCVSTDNEYTRMVWSL